VVVWRVTGIAEVIGLVDLVDVGRVVVFCVVWREVGRFVDCFVVERCVVVLIVVIEGKVTGTG